MRFWNVWGVVAGVALAVFVNATPTAAQVFQHPGVLVSKAQLDYIKAQYTARVNPFYREVLNVRRAHGSRTYQVQVNQYPPPIRRPTSAVRWRTRTSRLPISRRCSGTSWATKRIGHSESTLRESKHKLGRLRGCYVTAITADGSLRSLTLPWANRGCIGARRAVPNFWLDISPFSQTHTIME